MQYLILDWILERKGVNLIKEITDKTWKSEGRLNKKVLYQCSTVVM